MKKWLIKAGLWLAGTVLGIWLLWQGLTHGFRLFVQYVEPAIKPFVMWATNNGDPFNQAVVIAILIQLYLLSFVYLYKFYGWLNRV